MSIANVGNTQSFFSWINTTNQLVVMLNGLFESNGSLSLPSLNISNNLVVTDNVSATYIDLAGNDVGTELTNIWVQSNSTFVSINTIGTSANTVGVIANAAFNTTNAAFNTTNAASNTANTAYNLTVGAFNYANGIYISANSMAMIANAANQMGSFENRLLNGDFAINQRYETVFYDVYGYNGILWNGLNPTGSMVFSDAWVHEMGGNTVGVVNINPFTYPIWWAGIGTDIPDPIHSNTSLYIYINNAANTGVFASGQNSYVTLRQSIEGPDIDDLQWGTPNAANIWVSFWMIVYPPEEGSANIQGDYGMSFYNNAENRFYNTFLTYTGEENEGVWLYYSFGIPGDSNTSWSSAPNFPGLTISFSLGASADYQTNSIIDQWTSVGNSGILPISPTGCVNFANCNTATIGFTGMRIRKGNFDVPYYRRPYNTELRMCKRRFVKSYPSGVPVGTNTTTYDQEVDGAGSPYTNFNVTVPLIQNVGANGTYNWSLPFDTETIYPWWNESTSPGQTYYGGANAFMYQGLTLWGANGQVGAVNVDSPALANGNTSPASGYAGPKYMGMIWNKGTVEWTIGNAGGGVEQTYVAFHYALSADI